MKRITKRRLTRFGRRLLAIVYYGFGILATVIAANVSTVGYQVTIVVVGFVLAILVYYAESERQIRKSTDQKLDPILRHFVFPRVIKAYQEFHPDADPPPVRVNVMLHRHRDWLPSTAHRWIPPWRRYLEVDFSDGNSNYEHEDEIKWAVDEGVCGTALEYNKPIHSDLDDVEVHEWDMTPRQLQATEHLGSVVSIPIYLPEDEEKERPVGVLNLDSERDLSETRFDSMKKGLSKYASYIGLLV